MKIAIMQPTYLPWLGYFDLLDQVDQFVFLDSVQFEKRSWQQRNRIKIPTGLHLLTVPVDSKGKREQRIVEAQILGTDFLRDHLRAIESNYKRAPFFSRYFDSLAEEMRVLSVNGRLCELTIGMVRWFANVIGIRTPTVRSSEMPVRGKRTELLAEICVAVRASDYLSPLGSSQYLLEELPTMAAKRIEVAFHQYEHPTYRQLFPPFQPYACVLDVLLNEGDRTLDIIRSGRRAPLLPHEVALHPSEKVNS